MQNIGQNEDQMTGKHGEWRGLASGYAVCVCFHILIMAVAVFGYCVALISKFYAASLRYSATLQTSSQTSIPIPLLLVFFEKQKSHACQGT